MIGDLGYFVEKIFDVGVETVDELRLGEIPFLLRITYSAWCLIAEGLH